MKKRSLQLALLLLFVAAVVALRFSGLADVLTFENLQRNKDLLLARVQDRFLLSALLYIAIYVLAVAFSLPGAAVLSLAGGALFGTAAAVLFIVVGATAGAALAFLSARYLLGTRLQERYAAHLIRFNSEMERNGTRYLITLRLIPLFPFFVVNFLAGLTRISLVTFAWTTAVGILPWTAVFAYAGHQLESVRTVSDIFSARFLTAAVLLAVAILAPAVWSHFKAKQK